MTKTVGFIGLILESAWNTPCNDGSISPNFRSSRKATLETSAIDESGFSQSGSFFATRLDEESFHPQQRGLHDFRPLRSNGRLTGTQNVVSGRKMVVVGAAPETLQICTMSTIHLFVTMTYYGCWSNTHIYGAHFADHVDI